MKDFEEDEKKKKEKQNKKAGSGEFALIYRSNHLSRSTNFIFRF
jgi:hypothetical protein